MHPSVLLDRQDRPETEDPDLSGEKSDVQIGITGFRSYLQTTSEEPLGLSCHGILGSDFSEMGFILAILSSRVDLFHVERLESVSGRISHRLLWGKQASLRRTSKVRRSSRYI